MLAARCSSYELHPADIAPEAIWREAMGAFSWLLGLKTSGSRFF